MKLRFISVSILFCIIFISIVSCAKKAGDDFSETSTVSLSEQIDTEAVPEIPEEKYEGYTFNIASTNDNTNFDTWRFYYEEQSGEVVEDAFYTRNLNVEERHEIKFSAHKISMQQIMKSINADEDAYDIAFERAVSLPSVLSGGYMLELSEIPYLDLSWGFWDQNSLNDLSVSNNIMMAAGDIHLSSFDCTWTLYFDKVLIDDNNLENPYDLIDSNKWTLDKLNDLCKTVSRDLDGNGKMDHHDFYGFSTHQGTYPGLITATGEKFITKDNEGIPYMSMNTDKFYQAYTKILKLMHEDDAVYEQIEKMGSFSKNEQCDIFMEDRSIFFSEVMNMITNVLRTKENNYGIVPWPKYETTQDRYYNYVHEASAMMTIPKTASDIERTGVIVQDLAYESSKTVRPAYYEIAIVNKLSRDERMGEMLDIIFSNRTYELAFVYGWGGFSGAFYNLAVKNNSDLSSLIAKYEKKIIKDIEKYIDNVNENK